MDDDFFVGYLPLPRRLRRALWLVLAVLVCAALGIAALSAALREPPAASELQQVTLVGRVEARGYGVLWTPAPVLLARGGKFGARELAERLAGKLVSIRGLLLERDGTRMLEIGELDEHPTLDEPTRAALSQQTIHERGTVQLHGEIVDIKCWLGRMKPGDGRTHRACAQFCIAGGIPPVLAATDGRRYVLIDRAGRALNEAVLPFVAEPVVLDGELASAGAIDFLRIEPASIRRAADE